MSEVKYPQVSVKLIDEDGNALSIVGRVSKAMRRDGLSEEQVSEYTKEALSGDYNHVLSTTMNYVNEESMNDENEDYDECDDEWWNGALDDYGYEDENEDYDEEYKDFG